MADTKMSEYSARAREVIDWIRSEFPNVTSEERSVLLDKLLPPIDFWDPGGAARGAQGEPRVKAPLSLAEKYPELRLEVSKDGRLMIFRGHIEERERFNEFIADARRLGWEWEGRGTRELVRK